MLRWFQNKNSTYTESLGPYGARETIALLLYTSPKKKIVNQLITSSPPSGTSAKLLDPLPRL